MYAPDDDYIDIHELETEKEYPRGVILVCPICGFVMALSYKSNSFSVLDAGNDFAKHHWQRGKINVQVIMTNPGKNDPYLKPFEDYLH